MIANQCKCCGEELGEVFYLEITFGETCDDCYQGIQIGRYEFAKNGVSGIYFNPNGNER